MHSFELLAVRAPLLFHGRHGCNSPAETMQSVARIVSPEGRLCAFAAEVIGVGAEGVVSGGAAM